MINFNLIIIFFQANKERDQVLENNVLSSGDSGVGDTTTGGQSASGTSDCESGSTEKCANERGHPYPMFERQGSFINRERMIAHSTALESITINVDPTAASSHPGCAEDEEGKKLSLIISTPQSYNFRSDCAPLVIALFILQIIMMALDTQV